ncbi:MAG: ATP-dependent Clp protease ATP-binding subunit ClpX [Candidatus Lernaella stagnicola]|nr:ATP-dependent Clp protease ATP-binding subunit ClpX [Candidatus Lernaella stagnicola]
MVERITKRTIMPPREIYALLDRYVIGQEAAKRAVAVAAYNHQKRVAAAPHSLIRKSNMLLIGPTGSGKTHIARQLARVLDVPLTVVNATEYTEAGYYGKDVEVMVAELLFKTGGDVENTERGIVFVDEIDKIARRSQGARTGAGARDIGGEGVQQAILKLLEANEVFVPLNVTQHWNKHDFVQIDVSNILFICAGTFADLGRGRGKQQVGFTSPAGQGEQGRVGTRDLEDYGLLPELLGRLPIVVELGDLTDNELGLILTDPPDAIWREYQELFRHEDIKLQITQTGREAIVRETRRRKIGARGLRAIVEDILAELSFEAPEHEGEVVVVDGDYVRRHVS